VNETPIQVLIVGDSAVVRQGLSQALARQPGIEVMTTAADPIVALDRMRRNWPDVLILDIDTPRMDSLAFLRKLMAERPTPVIICSSLSVTGSDTLMQALAAGAVSIMSKPQFGPRGILDDPANSIVAAIRAAFRTKVRLRRPLPGASTVTPAKPPDLDRLARNTADAILAAGTGPVLKTVDKVIAIGTSTGGTQALEAVLTRLPLTMAGIVVVQHMPEQFTAMFAERLNSLCMIEVREGRNNDRVLPGRALIAPGGKHMLLKRSGAQYFVEVRRRTAGQPPQALGRCALSLGGPLCRQQCNRRDHDRHGRRRRARPQGNERCRRRDDRPGRSFVCGFRDAQGSDQARRRRPGPAALIEAN
jgi:two-component system chemotaxis response regulator CheB